jgi:membrane-bound lytic murein transglycosylase D
MNIVKKLAVASAAAFIALINADLASATSKTEDKKSKAELKKENTDLKAKIDSLKAELDRYYAEILRADSIANELAGTYTETKEDTIAVVEYTQEVSDSLLNIWYAQRLVSEEEIDIEGTDTAAFKSNVPDSVYIERIKAMNSFITLPYNDIVKNHIIRYSEKMPTAMGRIIGLCDYYMPIFQEIFDKYDMPEELKAMAIIESALNPLAVSRAGAKGMWQFMYQTAKIYGLHIDSFVDERLDPVKSADAAARYLKDAYGIFGDWNLAIASYNCGAGNVNKAIRRSGSRKFWDIWPFLPRETRGYGPAFVGALYTVKYYKEHGIKPEAVQMPPHVDTFHINKMLHLKQVSELTGAPLEELKNLNPQYKHEIIPGNEREYILRIPYQYTNAFIDCEDSLYTHKADIYFNPTTIKKIKDGGDGERIVYRVQNGDYLGRIATKYRVSVAQIKKWNNLKSNNIRVGQRLIIYRGGRAPVSTSSTAKPAASTTKPSTGSAQQSKPSGTTAKPSTTTSSAASGSYTIYTVKSGDSLYTIAKNYPGISAQNIMDFNGIDGSKIYPGMKIKIPSKM